MPATDFSINAPAVMDVEASGFGRASYPIEVGFVLPDGHAFCSLIRPESHWTHWDAQAEATHRISRSLIETRGRPVHEVAQAINTRLAGQTVYSDGWSHDYSWLGKLFDAADLTPTFRLENLRILLSETQANRWHQVKADIARERGTQRHRASADARLLQLTVQRVRALP